MSSLFLFDSFWRFMPVARTGPAGVCRKTAPSAPAPNIRLHSQLNSTQPLPCFTVKLKHTLSILKARQPNSCLLTFGTFIGSHEAVTSRKRNVIEQDGTVWHHPQIMVYIGFVINVKRYLSTASYHSATNFLVHSANYWKNQTSLSKNCVMSQLTSIKRLMIQLANWNS